MTDAEESIERLTAWIAECGHNKRREFTSDMVTVLDIARVAVKSERDKMNEEQFEAISRTTAWLRDYGDAKPQPFVDDIRILLVMAKESLNKPSVEDVLLSDAFLTKFAEAFTKSSVVTSKNQIDAAITALWETPFNTKYVSDLFPVAEVRSEHNADCVVEEPPPRDAMAASIAAQIEGGR